MFGQDLARLETDFFRGLNSIVEPLVRAGAGSPLFWPVGAIVLETAGRSTGRKYNVPLLAIRVGDMLVVSTSRRRSQWLKNLAADGEIRYWMGGRPHEATAYVFGRGIDAPPQGAVPSRASLSCQYPDTAESSIRSRLRDTGPSPISKEGHLIWQPQPNRPRQRGNHRQKSMRPALRARSPATS